MKVVFCLIEDFLQIGFLLIRLMENKKFRKCLVWYTKGDQTFAFFCNWGSRAIS